MYIVYSVQRMLDGEWCILDVICDLYAVNMSFYSVWCIVYLVGGTV